jgi:hypothetical protein
MAYAVAVRQFFNWCEQRGFQMEDIRPQTVVAYIEQLGAGMAKPSVKQHQASRAMPPPRHFGRDFLQLGQQVRRPGSIGAQALR